MSDQNNSPLSDTELLSRTKKSSPGCTDLLEDRNVDLSTKERVELICLFLANQQRGYEDHSQIRRIANNLDPTIDDLDKIIQDAFDRLEKIRDKRVIPTVSRKWEDKLWSRREKLQKELIDRQQRTGGIRIVADQPGVGKTTNSSVGLLEHNIRHFYACDRHEKAVDHKTKDLIAERGDYFHRKGRSQPLHDCCIEETECGHDSENPPLMCPVYERDKGDPILREFKRQERILGSHKEAHKRVSEAEDGCTWVEHIKELEEDDPDFVIGVHQHLTEFADRDIGVVDETPKPTTFQTEWETAELGRAASLLELLPDGAWLAEWVRELRRNIENSDRHQVSLRVDPPSHSITAEELAELKIEFNENLLPEKYTRDISERTQPCFDSILGALVQVGYKPRECRKVIDAPNTLESCPRCHAPTEAGSCVNCFWNRFDYSPLIEPFHPRVCAYIGEDSLVYTAIPDSKALPNSVILTDATPCPEYVAAFFGVQKDDIWHEVGPDFELNAHIIEIGSGQYHALTIRDSEKLRERIQRAIYKADTENQSVLYTLKSDLKGEFDFPDESIVRHYGAVKGIDITAVDAVMMIGAQHTHIEKTQHIVEALTLDRSDINIGGEEFTDTRTVQVGEKSREVGTKAFTGLVGGLFKNSREDEFLQVAHRPRPILAGEEITIYKISNVPTNLPVHERLTWAEFLNEGLPFQAMDQFVQPLRNEIDREEAVLTTPELKELASDDAVDRTVERWTKRLVDIGIAEEVPNFADLRTKKYRIDIESLRTLG